MIAHIAKSAVGLTDQRFGRLVVVARAGDRAGHQMWSCRCDCGQVVEVRGASLRSGNTRSCGCYHSERLKTDATTHGRTGSAEYVAWNSMLARCTNEKHDAFQWYGGQGVSVCDRWRDSFAAFLADMGDKPGPDHQLDRYPNATGNYEPGNVRWATRRQQCRNRTSNVRVAFRGEELCATEWAERVGISASTILKRLRRGWSAERAMTTPVGG